MAQTPGSPIGGIVVKGGKNPGGNIMLSLSGGINNPNSSIKTKANLVNGYALDGNVYVPFIASGGIGLHVGGGYFAGHDDYKLADLPTYNITGQSTAPSITVTNNGRKQNGFKAELGAQANFTLGKITLSPILDVAYFNLRQKAFDVTQSNAINGANSPKEIYSQEAGNTRGFAFIPKLRIAFFPGKLGFYLEGNYISGPDINTKSVLFKPQGKANDAGFYSQDQMAMGSNKSMNRSSVYHSFGVNFGISVPLGASKSSKRLRGKVTKPGDNGVNQAKPGNPIGGIIVKGGKNPGPRDMIVVTNENGEVTFTVTETGEYSLQFTMPQANGKSISEQGVKGNPSTGNKRKGRTYTGGRKNQGSDQNIQARPGSPIGGIVVKGGKNPGGNSINLITDENGEITFSIQEVGEYKFQITNQ